MSKREENPKKNRCVPSMECYHEKSRPCVYYRKKCKNLLYCNSPVAQANAMVLELQRMGFTVELKKKEGNQ